jgi:hypothetical protein
MQMLIHLDADPAYAAIRKHRAAIAAFSNYRGDDETDQYYRLEADMFAAQDAYWAAVPQTPEGFKAKVATFVRLERGNDFSVESLKSFFDTLCKSVDIIAGEHLSPGQPKRGA